MCKASEGTYKKFQEKKYGIKACTGTLKDEEISNLGVNLDLLKYLSKTKDKCCDFEKLIEALT